MPDFFPPLDRLRPMPDGRLRPDDLRTLQQAIERLNSLGRTDALPPLRVRYDDASGPAFDFTAELGFWVRLTGQLIDPVTSLPLPAYAWIEQTFAGDGSLLDNLAGRTDHAGQFPAAEVNGRTDLPVGGRQPVYAFLRPGYGESQTYSFDARETFATLRVTSGVPYNGRYRARIQVPDLQAETWADLPVPGVWVITPNGLAPAVARCQGRVVGVLCSAAYYQRATFNLLASLSPVAIALPTTTGVHVGDVVEIHDGTNGELKPVTAVTSGSITVAALAHPYSRPWVCLYSQRATNSPGPVSLTITLPNTEDMEVGEPVEVSGGGHADIAVVTAVNHNASITVGRLLWNYTNPQVRTLNRTVYEVPYDELQLIRVIGVKPVLFGVNPNAAYAQMSQVDLPSPFVRGDVPNPGTLEPVFPLKVWAYDPNRETLLPAVYHGRLTHNYPLVVHATSNAGPGNNVFVAVTPPAGFPLDALIGYVAVVTDGHDTEEALIEGFLIFGSTPVLVLSHLDNDYATPTLTIELLFFAIGTSPQPFWAAFQDYDDFSGVYTWHEVDPARHGDWKLTVNGRHGGDPLNPAYEADHNVLSVPFHSRISRTALPDGFGGVEWRFEKCCVPLPSSGSGSEGSEASGSDAESGSDSSSGSSDSGSVSGSGSGSSDSGSGSGSSPPPCCPSDVATIFITLSPTGGCACIAGVYTANKLPGLTFDGGTQWDADSVPVTCDGISRFVTVSASCHPQPDGTVRWFVGISMTGGGVGGSWYTQAPLPSGSCNPISGSGIAQQTSNDCGFGSGSENVPWSISE